MPRKRPIKKSRKKPTPTRTPPKSKVAARHRRHKNRRPKNRRKGVVTAALVIIGNEVLSGRTQDANLKFLAEGLNGLGIRLREARVIADDEPTIVATVNELRRRDDYVFTTGGIGPTHDDITAAAIAKAVKRRLERNVEAEARLRRHYRPEDITEARMSMADMPEGATLIDNPVSRAPGFQIENVFVLPGVPRIMQAMFDGLRARLKGGKPVFSKAVIAYIPEGVMAAPLEDVQKAYPETEIGSYPFFRLGKVGTSLVVRGVDHEKVNAAAEAIRGIIRGLGGRPEEG
ncbi:MAG TPA: molybdopterin-binding protein [Rhodospirillales bacterium]